MVEPPWRSEAPTSRARAGTRRPRDETRDRGVSVVNHPRPRDGTRDRYVSVVNHPRPRDGTWDRYVSVVNAGYQGFQLTPMRWDVSRLHKP